MREVVKSESETYGLRAVVGMGVDVEVFFGVRHVLGGVDLVEFSLSILDFLGVGGAVFRVLAEVGSEEGRVVGTDCLV